MSKNKWIILIVAVFFFILFVNVIDIHFNLYSLTSKVQNESFAVAANDHQYVPDLSTKRIGLFIENLNQQRTFKQFWASYLQARLKSRSFNNIVLLQDKESQGQKVDFVIRADLKTSVSWLPLIKKGCIDYDIVLEQFSPSYEGIQVETFTVAYFGKDDVHIKGIMSNTFTHKSMLSKLADNYADFLHKKIEQDLYKNQIPIIPSITVQPAQKNTRLSNNIDENMLNQYNNWLPTNKHNLNMFNIGDTSDQALIFYTTTESLENLTAFYNGLFQKLGITGGMWQNYEGGAKRYVVLKDNLSVEIKYHKAFTDSAELNKALEKARQATISPTENTPPQVQLEEEMPVKNVRISWSKPSLVQTLNMELENLVWTGSANLVSIEQRLQTVNTRDYFYYVALYNVERQKLIMQYWSKNFPGNPAKASSKSSIHATTEQILSVINNLAAFNSYPGADRYYRGDLYQLLGNLTGENDYFTKAIAEYQALSADFGQRSFGPGATSNLLAIEANPYYAHHDYEHVLKALNASNQNSILTVNKSDLLFKLGRYTEVEKTTKDNNLHSEIRILTLAALRRHETGLDSTRNDSIQNTDINLLEDLRFELVKAYGQNLRGNQAAAQAIIQKLWAKYPHWMIYNEANNLYIRTGLSFPFKTQGDI